MGKKTKYGGNIAKHFTAFYSVLLIFALLLGCMGSSLSALAQTGDSPQNSESDKGKYIVSLAQSDDIRICFKDSKDSSRFEFEPGETVKICGELADDVDANGILRIDMNLRDVADHYAILSNEEMADDFTYSFTMPDTDVSVRAIVEYKEMTEAQKRILESEMQALLESGWMPSSEAGSAETISEEGSAASIPEENSETAVLEENLDAAALSAAPYAAETIHMHIGGNHYYGGTYTTEYWCENADGTVLGYCMDPALPGPGTGTYYLDDVRNYMADPTDGPYEVVRRVAYFSWGAPGFNQNMWPSAWYDGTPMTTSRYVALSHILLSDVITYQGHYAMEGCSDGLKDWISQWVTGNSWRDGTLINNNATRYQCISAWTTGGVVPSSFKIYALNTGSGIQTIIGWRNVQEYGNLTIKKSSSNTGITNGNNNYSLSGAKYGVYTNAACTTLVDLSPWDSYLVTDKADGSCSEVMLLPVGRYYVKEITAPQGYKKNDTVYTVDITAGHTVTAPYVVRASDAPQTGKGKVQKVSSNPSVTNGNDAFSLAGAEYTIYSDASCTKKVTTLVTDASGNATSGDMALGTYYAKETKASKGFSLDKNTYTLKIEAGKTTTFTSKEEPLLGWLKMSKKSGDSNLTDGNACYSLAGAEYTVYSDSGCTKVAATLTTDADGNSNTVELSAGTYYAKETKASQGYLLCDGSLDRNKDGIHKVTVTAGKETMFTCTEPPANDPFALKLQKMDLDTGSTTGQGIASTEGAVFELTYYTNIEGKTDGTPFKKWYFRTNENGQLWCDSTASFVASKTLNDGTVLTSDALYTGSYGEIIYPVGTYCIKEVIPPEFYKLEGTMNFIENPTGKIDVNTGVKAIVKQSSNGVNPQIYDGNNIVLGVISAENLSINVSDKVHDDGSIKIIKLAQDTNKPLAGVTFKLVGLDTGLELTGTSDENGEVLFENLVPQRYVVTEIKTVDGYSLLQDNIEITLPIEMTEEEINANGADISKGVYDEAAGKYCFYHATFTIGNTVTFDLPMTGDSQTGLYLTLALAFALVGIGVWILIRRRKSVPVVL